MSEFRMFERNPSYYKTVLYLSVPIILQQLLRISVDTLDSMMLSRIDQIQMSAVTQAQQIFFIFYTLCSGFSAGCSVLIAQYWGKGALDKIKTLFAIGIRSITAFTIVVAAVVLLFPETLMRVYSNDPAVIALGASYLRTTVWMYVPCAVSTMLFACCRGIEEVKISFTVNAVSYPLNILIDYILIFGHFGFPEMGIQGAAVGAVVSRIAELLLLAAFVLLKEQKLRFRLPDLKRKDKGLFKSFLLVGAPIVAHELIWSTGTSAGNAVTGQMGQAVVGGYAVANVLYQLLNCVLNGILQGCTVVIGMTIGSGAAKEKIKRQAYTNVMIGGVSGIAMAVLALLMCVPFVGIYTLTPETRTYALSFILINVAIWPFCGMEMTGMIATLRAGGDGKTGFISDIFTMWLITIPLAVLGGFKLHWSPTAVIAVIKFNIVLEALVGIWRITTMKWVKNLTQS